MTHAGSVEGKSRFPLEAPLHQHTHNLHARQARTGLAAWAAPAVGRQACDSPPMAHGLSRNVWRANELHRVARPADLCRVKQFCQHARPSAARLTGSPPLRDAVPPSGHASFGAAWPLATRPGRVRRPPLLMGRATGQQRPWGAGMGRATGRLSWAAGQRSCGRRSIAARCEQQYPPRGQSSRRHPRRPPWCRHPGSPPPGRRFRPA